jgi:hypothetical protein
MMACRKSRTRSSGHQPKKLMAFFMTRFAAGRFVWRRALPAGSASAKTLAAPMLKQRATPASKRSEPEMKET